MREAGIHNDADQTPCLLAKTKDKSNPAVHILTFAAAWRIHQHGRGQKG